MALSGNPLTSRTSQLPGLREDGGIGVRLRGPRLTLLLIAGLVAVIALGAAAAVVIGHRTPTPGPGIQAAAPGRVVQSPRVPTTRSDPDLAVATPTRGPSTNLTVQLTPAAARHPRADEIKAVLQRYFDAINQHDYSAWSETVAAELATVQNAAAWQAAYSSTTDSTIWVMDVADDPLRVGVRFTSQQDAALAPSDIPATCIDWSLTYVVTEEDGHMVLGDTMRDSVRKAVCA